MIYTTLKHIREHNPCTVGWRKLLKHLDKTEADDEPLAYSTILESNGLDDALWCLRAEPQHSRIWRMYAVRRARRVQHLLTNEYSIRALDVAERHVRGEATDSELIIAWDAARPYTHKVAQLAAYNAALPHAWSAARLTAWDATNVVGDTARAEQTADFRAMLAAHHAMPEEACALVDWWQGNGS